MVSLLANGFHNDIHNLRTEVWESLEDLVHNTSCDLLKLLVSVLNQFESWISKSLKLRIDEVNEHINRWEARKSITFVHLDGLLYMHVIVL